MALFGKKQEPSDHFAAAGFANPTLIGTGASSNVFRAKEIAFDRVCAIKVFAVSFADGAARRRFERELRITGALGGHPNVVTVYRNGYLGDGRPFLSMEYCASGSAADRLRTGGPLPVLDAVCLTIKAAGALQAAHDAGVVHRDVKPQNLLLRRPNDPVVADFGVAAAVADNESDVEAMTLAHAAVEVLGGAPATAASDQWSLASTLYELLTGAPPSTRRPQESLMAWTVRVLETPPAVVLRADVPATLVDVISRALAKSPDERWPSVAAFAEALRAIEDEQGWEPTSYETSAGSVDMPKAPSAPPAPVTALAPVTSPAPATPPAPEAPLAWDLPDETDDTATVLRLRPTVTAVAAPGADRASRRRWPFVIAAVAIVALLAGGLVWAQQRSDQGTPTSPSTSPDITTSPGTSPSGSIAPTSAPPVAAAAYAPTNVRILDDTGDTVSLGWADASNGVTTYVIDVSQSSVTARPIERAQQATSTVVSGLTPGAPYCFAVGAVYAFGVPPAYASPVCRN